MGDSLVLLSGGMDSVTTLGIAVKDTRLSKNDKVHAITMDYGQSCSKEVEVAKQAFEWYKQNKKEYIGEHKIFNIDLTQVGGSALTDPSIELGTEEGEIPISYVPGRNTIFLAIAMGYAETMGCDKIYIGVNTVDFSGYRDCTPEYVKAMQGVFNVALDDEKPIEIKAPLLYMSKSKIIRVANKLGVPLQHTWSCYRNTDIACGTCDSCELRLQAFDELKKTDPIQYE